MTEARVWQYIAATLRPRLDSPDGPLPPLLLTLTLVTGLVDATSYLKLGHVFVANMTGNVVFLGFGIAGAGGIGVPTAGMSGLAIVESLEPLSGKTVLIVGAGGGVGSFATQFAVNAGGRVIANVRAANEERMRSYGVAETVDHTAAPLPRQVEQAHPDGIDVLVDLASDAEAFAALAALVRTGGTALTTLYLADVEDLEAGGVTAINFQLPASAELLQRVADALASGRIVAPPINRISLEETPAIFAAEYGGIPDGKTVIVLGQGESE